MGMLQKGVVLKNSSTKRRGTREVGGGFGLWRPKNA